jgi:predicted ribosome quality control (RQC) complex YloA/Tae2 family protein
MSTEEQQVIKQESYSEAIRYMENAKETLKKAGKEDYYYKDRKYVKTACGTAYNGVLIALDAYLSLKRIKKTKGRKSIEYYYEHLGRLDKKMLRQLDSVYEVLHLSGYYDGILNARTIKTGFDDAYGIIDKIKPEQP